MAQRTASEAGKESPALSPEDQALFLAAMEGVHPLPLPERVEIVAPRPHPMPRQRHQDETEALAESHSGTMSAEDHLDLESDGVFLRPGLPRRALADLRRGRWMIQSELDLHGYDREAARDALNHFLAEAIRREHRCVRIIHGKGLSSPGGLSVLKTLSRQWLVRSAEVLAFCHARPHDGGEGALLVLLRSERRR